MTDQFKKLWDCWIADRNHRKPHWKTWIRLLGQMPGIASQLEEERYYKIYNDCIAKGQYVVEPRARGRWVKGQWVMRSMS
jgi:hypothetical protein